MADAYAGSMSCEDVRRAITEGAVLDGALAAHAAACVACSELVAGPRSLAKLLATGADAAPVELSAGFERTMAGALQEETGVAARLRERPTRERQWLALASGAIVVGAVAGALPRPDLSVYPHGRLILAAVLLAALILLSVRRALRPLHEPPLPAWKDYLLVAIAVLLPVALSVLPPAHADHAASLAGADADLVARALRCFLFGSAISVPGFVLLWVLDRDEHRALVPVLAAAGSLGLVANLALQLHCPITHPAHLVLGHASIGFAALLAAALIRRARSR